MEMSQQELFSVQIVGVDRDHALARISDHSTSHEADAVLREREGPASVVKQGSLRHRALQVFFRFDATADEVQIATRIDGIWKRVSDLKNLGFLEATGQRREARSGRMQEVYAITPAGLEALERLEK